MWALARASAVHHRRSLAGVAVAVFLAAALSTGLGVLLESGLRGGVPAQRFAAADIIVGAPQSQSVPDDLPVPLTERAHVSDDIVSDIARIPGVADAIADVTIPLATESGDAVAAHSWQSAALTPYDLTSGTAPHTADDIVVDPSLGLTIGDTAVLSHGGIPHEYTVSGIAEPTVTSVDETQVFLSPDAIDALWPHPGMVDLVVVQAEQGMDAATLATEIRSAIPGVVTYTGIERGDAENLDAATARATLTALSGSLAGLALVIAMFVVASTLSLAIAQRREDIALLRAVGAQPRQIQRLLVGETTLIAGVAAVLAIAPGYALSWLLARTFETAQLFPHGFMLAISPLPAVGAALLTVATAALAAHASARRPANASPIDALAASHVQSPTLSRARLITGLTLVGAGAAAALTPLFLPGELGLAGAGSSALSMIIGTAVLGPRIVTAALSAIAPALRRSPAASAVLAEANVRGFSRRLSTAIIPLALGVTFALVQIAVPATIATEAARQAEHGATADLAVTAPAGVSEDAAARVAALDDVREVTPLIRSTAVVTTTLAADETMTESVPIQGVDPTASIDLIDLGVTAGALADLAQPDTVAVSQAQAASFGAGLGDAVQFTLGDGTPVTTTIVAIYQRALGFGPLTMAADALRPHTSDALDDALLVATAPGTVTAVGAEIRDLGLQTTDAAALGHVETDEAAQSWASVAALLLLLGFIALAVVNTLVMATSERRAEFALLRRLGSTRGQVTAMAMIEATFTVVVATLLGLVVAVIPLVGIALGVSGQPVPSVSPLVLGVIVAVTALIGFAATLVPTRSAMRGDLAYADAA
ncbi:ABC transporter permease [Paramicrobacterium sp. CJ85]|uniref:ABC transporter permease n=1 Tax=Paramicrobacterium sp. CJ85 TaxID=3445355 RepID=UPI003F5E6ABE